MHKNKNILLNSAGKLFVISGPTGAGKTFVTTSALPLLSKYKIARVVTCTTRPPRQGEINGVDYQFLDKQSFKEKEKSGFFFETAAYANNWYGSPQSMIDTLKQGQSWLLITDRSGSLVIKKLFPYAVLVWIDASSLDILEKGLIARDGIKAPARFSIAKEETLVEQKNHLFDYHIINDHVSNQATLQLVTIIKKELA